MDKILTRKCFADFRKTHEAEKIVFANGCFDVLHVSHVDYLQKATELGDLLIIGLNSDVSVRRLKGSSRPINNQLDRAAVLTALECVSYVAIFDEDTPLIFLSMEEIISQRKLSAGKKLKQEAESWCCFRL